ncbi:MAG TPA: right-handed parallel beta-helix repeat-containing protein [Candidatus Dormibacteraeota bacterium]|nr:right-handed parallel beta-helix repeat-containing protein [Candidatus Dormibacteraeota bacterium]
MKLERVLFFGIAFLFLCASSHAQLWSGVLSPSRAVDWTQAGIPGGIPSNSWAQCGATIAPYAGPASTINAAIGACGTNQFVLLGPGTFNLTTPIIIKGKSNVVLRGSGANSTFLVFNATPGNCTGGSTNCLINIQSSDGTYIGNPANVFSWMAGFAQGTTSITLSSGAKIVAGVTSIVLDQCDNGSSGSTCAGNIADNGNFFNCAKMYSSSDSTGCSLDGPDGQARMNRNQWEIVEAVSCNPACGFAGITAVTIRPPLQHPQWSPGQTPQAWLIQPSQYVGIENLSVDSLAVTPAEVIGFGNMSYGWVRGVRISNGWQAGIYSATSNHMEFESNYIYNTGRSGAYVDPFGIRYNGSNYLIQNNIIQKTRVPILAEGPAPGSVIGYNFIVNNYFDSDFMFAGFEPHAAGNNYQLYEGNIGPGMIYEDSHGTQSMNTSFRNLFMGWESCANGQCGLQVFKDSSTNAFRSAAFSRYQNVVGNVLGTPGVQTGYQATDGYPFIYVLGNGDGNRGISPDPLVASTLLRWGNYDTVSKAVRWCGNASDTGWGETCKNSAEVPTQISPYPNAIPTRGDTGVGQPPLPASFYLVSKPSWFGSLPWPAIGPDVTGGNIGQCSGIINTIGQFSGLPATSVSQCLGTNLTTPAWGGHVNTNPAMNCFLNVMKGRPDGTGGELAFDANACYGNSGGLGQTKPPTGLKAVVK